MTDIPSTAIPPDTSASQPRRKALLLIVSGGIAVVKTLDLVRQMIASGWDVQVLTTASAEQFIAPLTFATLTGNPVLNDMFDAQDPMAHIHASRDKDLLAVVPATANVIAKYSLGIADDFATTTLLASTAPVLIAPAMNPTMWQSEPIQEAVSRLRRRETTFVGPDIGPTACGEEGQGRMAAPATIADTIIDLFQDNLAKQSSRPKLLGRRVIITSGATRETIDPVRFLSNHSSGKQGHAIAAAAAAAGACVTLIQGIGSPPPPLGVSVETVESACDMKEMVLSALPADIAICVAAVSDWRVAEPHSRKMKRGNDQELTISLVANPDILATVASHPEARPELVIGFAAETDDVIGNAKEKLVRKGCDWIIANRVGGEGCAMGSDYNQITLVTPDSIHEWPNLTKEKVAQRLIDALASELEIRDTKRQT